MSITYTWSMTSMKTKAIGSTENVVVQTYWKKTGTDANGNEGSFSGATPFPVTEVAGGFTEFADLTETQVLSWIKSKVTGSYEDHVNDVIQKQINEVATPVTDTDMPWAIPEEVVAP